MEDSLVSLERTFAIIKPDAITAGKQGEILSRIHKAGFTIVAIKSMRLSKEEASGFYFTVSDGPYLLQRTCIVIWQQLAYAVKL